MWYFRDGFSHIESTDSMIPLPEQGSVMQSYPSSSGIIGRGGPQPFESPDNQNLDKQRSNVLC